MPIASAILIAIIMAMPIARGPGPLARGQGPGPWAGARGPGRGDGPGVLASKALWPKPSKAHAAMAAMATLDGALLSDEMLRLVVAFVPEERKAWMKTKRCWYVRLLRLKEINLILNILVVLNKPGISQGFFSQMAARFNALRHRFAQEVG